MTGSTLDLTPRTTVRGVGSNAEPAHPSTRTAYGSALARAATPDYFGWLDHVRAAAGCTRPIRLVGQLLTVEAGTGRLLDQRHTDQLPDASIYKACGNRRHTVCPACARTYQADAYQLLRAGLVGGKGVPGTVARHPAVFLTLTAPSFGAVHTRNVRNHTCTNRRRCDCRPDPCRARRTGSHPATCQHGRAAVCWARHESTDPRLGQPLCLDCYDHDHQVVWNLSAGELWRRTKQAAERHLAQLAKQRGIPPVSVPTASGKPRRVAPVRISHGKAAEFQARGAVHFHALLRLDGVDPTNPDAIVPPPAGFDTADLDEAITSAAAQTTYTTPAHPDRPGGWHITWGDEGKGHHADVRPITLTGRGEVTDQMVASYLAKYATKSTEITGHNSTRITADTIDDHADPDGEHTARLIDACWRLGRPTHTPRPLAGRSHSVQSGLRRRWSCPDCGGDTRLAACLRCAPSSQPNLDSGAPNPGPGNPYQGLRRWAHMLGFGGHFLTKARRYSVTFTLLRAGRITYRRVNDAGPAADQPIRTAEHLGDETTLIVGTLTFAGTGWHTTGDALLANTSAAMARARHAAAREELTHEIGITRIAGSEPAAA